MGSVCLLLLLLLLLRRNTNKQIYFKDDLVWATYKQKRVVGVVDSFSWFTNKYSIHGPGYEVKVDKSKLTRRDLDVEARDVKVEVADEYFDEDDDLVIEAPVVVVESEEEVEEEQVVESEVEEGQKEDGPQEAVLESIPIVEAPPSAYYNPGDIVLHLREEAQVLEVDASTLTYTVSSLKTGKSVGSVPEKKLKPVEFSVGDLVEVLKGKAWMKAQIEEKLAKGYSVLELSSGDVFGSTQVRAARSAYRVGDQVQVRETVEDHDKGQWVFGRVVQLLEDDKFLVVSEDSGGETVCTHTQIRWPHYKVGESVLVFNPEDETWGQGKVGLLVWVEYMLHYLSSKNI